MIKFFAISVFLLSECLIAFVYSYILLVCSYSGKSKLIRFLVFILFIAIVFNRQFYYSIAINIRCIKTVFWSYSYGFFLFFMIFSK